jgi:outer membrane translocation and assembly module TamA
MTRITIKILLTILAIATMASCSTTSRLAEGEVLYTGVKKLKYNELDSAKIEGGVKDQIFTVINVKPNNPLYSPYYRTPFPIGLWVYNHWDENAKGLKGWLYKKLVAKPVLISRVRPQTRVKMIDQILHDNGYFDSSSSYELLYDKKNPKKAKIDYQVNVKPPYTLGNISYLEDDSEQNHIIDSVAINNEYFKTGNRYCADSLNSVRINIANELRNRGYYYFRPEYIEYLADSVTRKRTINMQMIKAADVPNQASTRFLANNVYVTVDDFNGGGTPDTIVTRNCTLIKMQPVHINNKLIPSCIRGRKGRPFRVGNMDLIQMYLARTGIFSNINMQALPLDTLLDNGYGLMDLDIHCTLDKPIEVKLEAKGTTKSNSFIGPGLGLGIKHKNIFGGAEQLSADLTASYEWQTGKGGAYKTSDFNSYQIGLDLGLAIPRLLAPRFIDRARRYLNWTRFTIGGEFLNRPKFFKMARLSADMTWEWHSRRNSYHKFTPLKITYSNLLSTTAAFDSAYYDNKAIQQSFQDVFIPQMSYTYTYEKTFGMNTIMWNTTLTEAGNICYVLWRMCGAEKGMMHIMNTNFSQFIKAQTQVVWTRHLMGDHKIVGRAFLGVAHAYGNSTQVPYMEQFYIGGSNSLRGFSVRSVGPGSYRAEIKNSHLFFDQTGTFKFETNWEYRFPLFSYFKGAVFVDAGNVWLLEDDYLREGGKLKFKNFFKELALNTGLGLRFDMGMIVVRADLGIALHAPYDTGKKGYFNMPKFKDSLAFHLAIGYPF